MSEHASEQSDAAAPVLRVVKGDPSAEELAALVAVVASRTTGAGEPDSAPKVRSRWGDPAYAVRPVLTPGPNGWRRSAFPR
ncbi:acyl-CoA carboxylase subunit epsilon [Nocardioidaceae bacterium SCSIO 66511]|nr:acyl-CoA carboxylase subunit epsilon [Nocardioidaceae bacterium SCSIO 66511]